MNFSVSRVRSWAGCSWRWNEPCRSMISLLNQPGFDRKFTHERYPRDAEWCAEHAGCVEGGEAESVDGKLQDQDLEDQGDVDRIFDQNEAEDLRYPMPGSA